MRNESVLARRKLRSQDTQRMEEIVYRGSNAAGLKADCTLNETRDRSCGRHDGIGNRSRRGILYGSRCGFLNGRHEIIVGSVVGEAQEFGDLECGKGAEQHARHQREYKVESQSAPPLRPRPAFIQNTAPQLNRFRRA